jgi:hypothetical protein
MRKTILLAAFAVALVAIPVIAIGQTSSSFGLPPDVYTQTFPGDYCGETDLSETAAVMSQEVSLWAESSVVLYFSFEAGFENPRQEILVSFGLDGSDAALEGQEWGIAAPASTTARYFGSRQSTSLMWTFDHVEAGNHTVQAFARVSKGVAEMNGCALTVLVSPTIS